MRHEFKFENRVGKELKGYAWLTDGDCKGLVVLIHGMQEHSLRYDKFANDLSAQGYNVYAIDLVNHGIQAKTAAELGVWKKTSFDRCVMNLHDLVLLLSQSTAPIVLFGHSMGSFIAEEYMLQHSNWIDGLVLSGTSGPQFSFKLGYRAARFISHFNKKQQFEESHFFSNMMTKSMMKNINSGDKKYGWLSKDEENVYNYINDPLCGFPCSFNLFYALFTAQRNLFIQKRYNNVKDKVPTLFVTGADDNLSKRGHTIFKLEKIYNKAGIPNTSHFYQRARHEILFEECYQAVFKDVLSYLNSTLPACHVVNEPVATDK